MSSVHRCPLSVTENGERSTDDGRATPEGDTLLGAIVPFMKRLVPIAVAAAIVAVLVSIKARRSSEPSPDDAGSWELADEYEGR